MRKSVTLMGAILFASLSAHAEVLIKNSEAALPQANDVVYRGISRGTGVKVIAPAAGAEAVSSPLHLKLVFEPHGGAKVDPSSVEVVYLKSPSVDLTERVKKGLSATGIDLANAEVPPGEHRLRVTVTDSNGLTSNSEITLRVVK